MKIVDRQTINIGTDLHAAGGNNFYVPITLRFFPDEVIVRSVAYADTNSDTVAHACQVWTNLVDDGVIAAFASNVSYSEESHHIFKCTKRIQTGNYNFQVQFLPTIAANSSQTGPGSLATFSVVNGELLLILEFIKLGE